MIETNVIDWNGLKDPEAFKFAIRQLTRQSFAEGNVNPDTLLRRIEGFGYPTPISAQLTKIIRKLSK